MPHFNVGILKHEMGLHILLLEKSHKSLIFRCFRTLFPVGFIYIRIRECLWQLFC